MEAQTIPPKNEWKDLTVDQLMDVRMKLVDTYYSLKSTNASFKNQYLIMSKEVDALISLKESQVETAD